MEEIDIWWEGPYSPIDIIDNKIKKEDSDNIQKDIGLYQVYSAHPLYGNNVLVYIGLTTNSFSKRLKSRWVIENGIDPNNVQIYLGCIFSPNKELDRQTQIEMIKKSESLLINALSPAFNSSNIQTVHQKYTSANYIIRNHGSYKNIYPELSSNYFLNNRFKNYEITDKLANIFKETPIEQNDFYGFDLSNNDNICVGVDYNYWNKFDVPLVIGIYKKINITKEELQNKFQDIGEDTEYYFISASDDLTKDNVLDEIKLKIKQVLDVCNK